MPLNNQAQEAWRRQGEASQYAWQEQSHIQAGLLSTAILHTSDDSDLDEEQASPHHHFGPSGMVPSSPHGVSKLQLGRHQRTDDQGNSQFEGPCHLKMLMPNHIAGALIGKEGVVIGEIMMLSRCQMQISDVESFFPGTTDRVVIMSGSMDGLAECIKMTLRRLKEVSGKTDQGNVTLLAKLSVPSSAVSGLIGHQGDKVKKLSDQMRCRINVSTRVEGMKERLVLICGEFHHLVSAVIEIARRIQSDSHLKDNLTLKYDIQLPLGAWSGEKAQPADPDVPLIPVEDADCYTKRELVNYLHQAAPREILLKHNLLGNMKNTLKSKGSESLKQALQDTMDARILMASSDQLVVRKRPNDEDGDEGDVAFSEPVTSIPGLQSKIPLAPLPFAEVGRQPALRGEHSGSASQLGSGLPHFSQKPLHGASPQPADPDCCLSPRPSPMPAGRRFLLVCSPKGADAAAGAAVRGASHASESSLSQPGLHQGPEAGAGVPVVQSQTEAPGHELDSLIIPALHRSESRDAMNLSFSFLAPGTGTVSLESPEACAQETLSPRLDVDDVRRLLLEKSTVPDCCYEAPDVAIQPGGGQRRPSMLGPQQLAHQVLLSTCSIAGGATCSIESMGKNLMGSLFAKADKCEESRETCVQVSESSDGQRCRASQIPLQSTLVDPTPSRHVFLTQRNSQETGSLSSPRSSAVVHDRELHIPRRGGSATAISLLAKPKPQQQATHNQDMAERPAGKSGVEPRSSRICSSASLQSCSFRFCTLDPFQNWFNPKAAPDVGPPKRRRHGLPRAPTCPED